MQRLILVSGKTDDISGKLWHLTMEIPGDTQNNTKLSEASNSQ